MGKINGDSFSTALKKHVLAQQQTGLEKQRLEAEAKSARLREQRVGRQKHLRGSLAGRRSLITNVGGELGTKDSLG